MSISIVCTCGRQLEPSGGSAVAIVECSACGKTWSVAEINDLDPTHSPDEGYRSPLHPGPTPKPTALGDFDSEEYPSEELEFGEVPDREPEFEEEPEFVEVDPAVLEASTLLDRVDEWSFDRLGVYMFRKPEQPTWKSEVKEWLVAGVIGVSSFAVIAVVFGSIFYYAR